MKGNDKTLILHLAAFKKKLKGRLKFQVTCYNPTIGDEEILIKNLFDPKLIEDDATNLYQMREVPDGLEFRVRDYYNDTVLRFFLQCFPGCCGVQVIKYAYVLPPYRGKNLSYALLDIAMALSKWFNYTILTGTVSSEQPTMNFVLKKRKEWKMVKSFKSARTGNKIHMWLTEIKY